MAKSNLAYDFSRYSDTNTAEKISKQRKEEISIHRAKAASAGSIMKFFLIAAAAVLLLSLAVEGKVETTAIHNEIAKQKEYVDMLQSENVRMQTEIESKSAFKAVEDYAENVLGMQKLEKSQIEYINLESGNVVEIPKENDNLFLQIKYAFLNFVEYLKG